MTAPDLRLVIAGAAGRMGRTLVRAASEQPGAVVVGATEHAGSHHLGADCGTLAGVGANGVMIVSDASAAAASADAIVDFTLPQSSAELARLAGERSLVHVIGTTGFGDAEEGAIAQASRTATIVKSGNMSLGVNLLAALVRQAARALDPSFDIEIVEMHHNRKIDAPSGTALLLGEAAASGRGVDLREASVRSRDGHTGARQIGTIGFASLRGGTVTGEHSVIFAGAAERIELTHRAEDRMIFARGAIHAALWARGRPPGLYSMADVLGIDAK